MKVAVAAIVAVALAIGALVAATAPAASTAPKPKSCGTKLLYGKPLELRIRGRQLDCAQVRRIVRGGCRQRRAWTCFPPREPWPALEWFRTREEFSGHLSTEIEALRWSCADADVTADAWTTARKRLSGYPSRAQVLADDTLRCHLLVGMDRQGIVALLGEPDDHDGSRYIDYELGAERDSLFAIDDEILSIELDRQGRFVRAEIVQT